jgi:hypothetical protein
MKTIFRNFIKAISALCIFTTGLAVAGDTLVVTNEDDIVNVVAVVYTRGKHTKVVEPESGAVKYQKLQPGERATFQKLPRKFGYDRDLIVGPALKETFSMLNGWEDIDPELEVYYLNLGDLQNVNEVKINKKGKPLKVK